MYAFVPSNSSQLPSVRRLRGRFPGWIGGVLLTFGLLGALPLRAAAAQPTPDTCLACHGDKDFSTQADGKTVSLFVNGDRFNASVHKDISCQGCHSDVDVATHPGVAPKPVDCGKCHTEEAKEYAGSIHGVSSALGAKGPAKCVDCHGNHDILPVSNPASPVYKMNLPATCGKCHTQNNIPAEFKMKYPNVATQFQESIHGKALLQLGLIVAPSCDDCHGVHNIRRAVDAASPISHANVAKTCGKCHVTVEATYDKSIHGQLLAKGDPRAPNCIDCHSAHQIVNPNVKNFKEQSDIVCGKCHQDRLEHYRETYHGKAMALGQANSTAEVAACYDCHGNHDVLPPSDPASRLSQANIVHTCQKCHPGATRSFTKFEPHANPLDGKHYPFLHLIFVVMTALLIGVFTLFGAHTLLWLFRSAYLYLHDSKTFREAKIKIAEDEEQFTRFQPFERFLHLLMVSSFLLLVLTGMPLKFYYTAWARAFFHFFGGPEVARTLHHFAAVITFAYFFLHVTNTIGHLWRRRSFLRDPQTGRFRPTRIFKAMAHPDSMIPTAQDWRDFIAHNKWFFGKGPKPQFDRWTYWEKFDYLAVFWGIFAIGLSGLIMWFPTFFSHFMPGWMINVANLIHSDEALLAAGFIFTVHFFNTHFRLEKFPMDTVIFSGRVSKSELLHERKRWYDRLVAEGRLDDYKVKDEWNNWKSIARSFGYAFFGLGLVLLVMIIYAMTVRLLH